MSEPRFRDDVAHGLARDVFDLTENVVQPETEDMTDTIRPTDLKPTDAAPRIAQAASLVRTGPSTPPSPANVPAVAPSTGADTAASGDVHHEKDVAFYGAVVNAWIGTKMEFDKSLLTMSLAGIGVIVSLLTTVGMGSLFALVTFLVAAGAFTAVLGLCLAIFWFNANFLESLALGGGSEGDRRTRRLGAWATGLFAAGIVSAILAAGGAAVYKYQHRDDPPPTAASIPHETRAGATPPKPITLPDQQPSSLLSPPQPTPTSTGPTGPSMPPTRNPSTQTTTKL